MAKKKEKVEVLTEEGVLAQVKALSQELFSLRDELAVNRKLEKPHLLKAKKKERARALTKLTLMRKSSSGKGA